MLVKFNLNINCELCGNKDERQFYIMPIEEEVMDGKVFSLTKYKLVCKRCKKEILIELNIK